MSVFKVWSFIMMAFGKLFGLLGIIATSLLFISAIIDFANGGGHYADSIGTLIVFLLFISLLFYLFVKIITVKKMI